MRTVTDGSDVLNEPGPNTVQRVLEAAHQEILVERQPQGVLKIGPVELTAWGDRAFIIEDEFRSGYECAVCNGKGKVVCDDCSGSGYSPVNPNIRCKTCEGSAIMRCPECNGKGGLLVTPEISQRRPTTGTIMSMGPGTWQNGVFVATTFKVGDSVLYSNFAGYAMDIDAKVVRILHEVEIFGKVKGHLEIRRGGSQREMPDSNDSLNASMVDRGRK